MPLPRHTPVASLPSSLAESHPESLRAISLAAMAYWVKADMRRCSAVVSQSAAFHWPLALPRGTTPATVLVNSCHRTRGSREATLVMPDSPARSRDQVRRTPTPRGVMAPRPVTTTRRMLAFPCPVFGERLRLGQIEHLCRPKRML